MTWGVDANAARMHLTALTRPYYKSAAKEDMFLMGADLSTAIIRAFEADNIGAAQQLAEEAFGRGAARAIMPIIDDKTVTEDVKTARLKLLLQWNVPTDDAMQTLADRNDTGNLGRLIRLGVSAENIMMDLSKQGDTRRIAALIVAGADIAKPMQTLQTSNEQEALRTLTTALAIAQSNSILAHARTNNLSYRINPSGRVELL